MKAKTVWAIISSIMIMLPVLGMKNLIKKSNIKTVLKNIQYSNKYTIPKTSVNAYKKNEFRDYSTNIKGHREFHTTPTLGEDTWNIINTDFYAPKDYFASDSPFRSNNAFTQLNHDDVGKIKTDIDITLKRIENEYKINIHHLKSMIQKKDPTLEKYTSDFFKEKKESFYRDLNRVKTIIENKLELIKNGKQQETLVEHLKDGYKTTERHVNINLSQAEGYVRKYQKPRGPQLSFIERWKKSLGFGPKATMQKQSYSTGTGYFRGKINQK